jgi:hypothetical protein
VYVRGALLLRWENKFEVGEVGLAAEENASKLKEWSTLYYSKLPYVIGGCCGGGSFQWLKLSPNGKVIRLEIISRPFDLPTAKGIADLLHSVIRMHCLLQKLQETLTEFPPMQLYAKIPRADGGAVTIYPGSIQKELNALKSGDVKELQALYDNTAQSKYLIHLEDKIISIRAKTTLRLAPVGDPNARPRTLEDLENATHDMLHGLADLHKVGYAHRDLRWENCIKVNVRSDWKWVIIDLELAGPDEEEWIDKPLKVWDAGTLEDRNGKKIYTKGSDIYHNVVYRDFVTVT